MRRILIDEVSAAPAAAGNGIGMIVIKRIKEAGRKPGCKKVEVLRDAGIGVQLVAADGPIAPLGNIGVGIALVAVAALSRYKIAGIPVLSAWPV